MLPPYQFEKHRHWLEWIDTASEPTAPLPTAVKVEEEPELLSFVGYSDRNQREAEFAVDPRSEAFKHYVSGHAVLSQALCPASLYVELVAEAATTLVPSSQPSSLVPCIDHLDIKSPLGLNDRVISISLKKREGSKLRGVSRFRVVLAVSKQVTHLARNSMLAVASALIPLR